MYYYITINTASTILTLLRYVFLQSYMCIQLSFVNFNLMKMIKKKNESNNYLLLFNVAKVIKFLAYFKITIRRL